MIFRFVGSYFVIYCLAEFGTIPTTLMQLVGADWVLEELWLISVHNPLGFGHLTALTVHFFGTGGLLR